MITAYEREAVRPLPVGWSYVNGMPFNPNYLEDQETISEKIRLQGSQAPDPVKEYVKPVPPVKFVHRLGYHNCVSNSTGGNAVNRFSGSSINRQKRKNEMLASLERNGTESAAIRFVEKVGIGARNIPAWVCPGLLSEDQVRKIQIRKQVPRTPKRDVQPVHVLSSRSKGIVRNRFAAFYRAAGGSKTFCTLTFINDVADSAAIGILNKFLTALREKFPRLQYIWIAERQLEKTGRIHFHMIINKFLPVVKYNALWVTQQYNSGITHPLYSLDEILQFAREGILQKKLSPLDVRKVKNVSVLSAYLTKYITKGNNQGGFGCAVWHCSRDVSKLYLRTVVGWEVVNLAKSDANARFNRKTGEYYGPPLTIAGRTGKNGGFLYVVYPLNQPGRFLCYLREMEQLNKWICCQDPPTVQDLIDYTSAPLAESLICLN
jgi:hypothetical protein